MSGTLTIRHARLVLPDRVVTGDVVVVDGVIEQIGPELARTEGEVFDADGLTVLPGLVDVGAALPLHADEGAAVARETGAAALAGITSMLMLDPDAPAHDAARIDAQLAVAQRHARVHTGVFARPGADGALDLGEARTPGVWVGVGRWRGRDGVALDQLEDLVAGADRVLCIEGQDPQAAAAREAIYEDAVDPEEHARIYTADLAATVVAEACRAARTHGTRVVLPRVSSRAELDALDPEAPVHALTAVPYLFLAAEAAVARLGARSVTVPPLRTADDAAALWAALHDGRLWGVASGHGAVPVGAKDAWYPDTPSGLPTADVLLPLLLERVQRGEITLPQVARWTADAPARAFGLPRQGRLEVGFEADLVLVDTAADVLVSSPYRSWSGWSPFDGFHLRGRVVTTLLRGRPVVRDGALVDGVRGQALTFTRT